MRAVPVPPDRRDQAESDRGARQVRGAVAAARRPIRSRACAAASTSYRDAILMPTYHPAYLLRTPSAKREVWEDMKRVKAILDVDRSLRLVSVAVPVPLLDLLTYNVPPSSSCRRSARACACRSDRARSSAVSSGMTRTSTPAPRRGRREVLDEEPFLPAGDRRAVPVGGRVLHGRDWRCHRRGDAARRRGRARRATSFDRVGRRVRHTAWRRSDRRRRPEPGRASRRALTPKQREALEDARGRARRPAHVRAARPRHRRGRGAPPCRAGLVRLSRRARRARPVRSARP